MFLNANIKCKYCYLVLLETKDLSKEIELLQKNKAVGGPKHHQLIVSLFTEIRSMLAECLFYYSIQFGLSKQQMIRYSHAK